jgi:hypothetical protein
LGLPNQNIASVVRRSRRENKLKIENGLHIASTKNQKMIEDPDQLSDIVARLRALAINLEEYMARWTILDYSQGPHPGESAQAVLWDRDKSLRLNYAPPAGRLIHRAIQIGALRNRQPALRQTLMKTFGNAKETPILKILENQNGIPMDFVFGLMFRQGCSKWIRQKRPDLESRRGDVVVVGQGYLAFIKFIANEIEEEGHGLEK